TNGLAPVCGGAGGRSVNRVSPIEVRATAEGSSGRASPCSPAPGASSGRLADARVLQADMGGYTLRYVTPFSRMRRAPARYGIEVWLFRRGKVFSAWWKPFRVPLFIRGPWMNSFVPGSYVLPPARSTP